MPKLTEWVNWMCAVAAVAVAVVGCSPWVAPQSARAAPPPSDARPSAEPTPEQVFKRRILPIFQSPEPSSCVQCHLAGVDLKKYILPSHEKTFLSLRDQGLIDLDRPEKSKILKLISMREAGGRGADLIYAKVRAAEFEAFAAWIRTSCADPKLRAARPLAAGERAGPERPVEVIRHARKDRLLESFERNVWAWRFRCMSCHTEGTPENDKLVKQHGPRVAWVKKAGPAATLDYLLASRLIDSKQPDRSLLIRKPLGEVKHEGGKKFLPGDQAHKGFRSWVEDVAAIRADRYSRAEELPARDDGPLRFGTNLWLKLIDTPAEWADKLVQVDVHAWDAAKKDWEVRPIATSDRGVWGKGRLWQHTLTLLAPAGSAQAKAWATGTPALAPGRYRIRVFVDGEGRLSRDWKATLGEPQYVGAAEFQARWREGYGDMTTVSAGSVKR